jgi:leucyl-tRNA synthetase
MPKYNHQELEKKWQAAWLATELDKTEETSDKPKYYCLDMFPYPSGAGLHVGHPKGYIATDIISRYKRLNGYSVLHPMGWDAFGLPAENYALANKVHPRVATEANIATYKRQLSMIGLSYDWSREINTTDPEYYKWTQWIFAEMFKKGLVFESYEPINWCPTCLTGLANEDLDNGKCERCGSEVEKKPMRQWVIRITDYAERLLADIDQLTDWEESIKEMQRNWLGKSEGATLKFAIINSQLTVEVFTTRPDTIFGATYLVLAPEHELVAASKELISNWLEVQEYINKVKNKSDLERTDLNKDKSGVQLKGLMAINPVNQQEIPVFVADYVLAGYGTGAIMAVPAHDERDWDFAKKYNLPIKQVVESGVELGDRVMTDAGVAINSDFLDGLATPEAKTKMIEHLEKNSLGAKKINWKLKDWVFSRQRYWGEPMPLVFCQACKDRASFDNDGERLNPGWFVDANLPVRLPEVESYQPSGTGESPLANISEWVNIKCPRCGGEARRETNTMPQWAGSSWYYIAYAMRSINNDQLTMINYREVLDKWLPVDMYVGGAEHATRHLIYARFWHKFLFDIGVVNCSEPFTALRQVGLILAEDGRKMSKRWANVINPDQIIQSHGADALRVYEMFMGPFNQSVAWSTNGLTGARKFLDKVWNLSEKLSDEADSREIERLLHKTIRKIGADIESLAFNTVVSALMILVNAWTAEAKVNRVNFRQLVILLSPLAPHLAEELWQLSGADSSVFKQTWPMCNEELARDDKVNLTVQINGKLRDTLELDFDSEESVVRELIASNDKVQKWLAGQEIVKVVFVKNKLINFVLK